MNKKVLIIVGPTGIGKSDFGIKCAKAFSGEIISGDSIQVYRGLNIGSAKIKEEEKEDIPHYLIDIKDPKDTYSVKEFQDNARVLIEEITNKNKLPIIVGGTGLYIKATLYDYEFYDEEKPDEQYDNLSNEELYQLLEQLDKEALNNIHINNRKRMIRAINIATKHEKNITEIKSSQKHEPIYDSLIIGLTAPREEIYKKIEKRFHQMIDEGLLDEIKSLLDNGVNFDDRSMSGIGYKEFKGYFSENESLDSCIEKAISNTKHFVKRQYTWFNNQLDVKWFDDKEKALECIKDWYE